MAYITLSQRRRLRKVGDSDTCHDFPCSLCDKKGKNVAAIKRCNECAENLCGDCIESHNMFPATRSHPLVDKADIGQGQASASASSTPSSVDIQYPPKVAPQMAPVQTPSYTVTRARTSPSTVGPPSSTCTVHHGKIIELYCSKHDEVGCATCFNISHRSCADYCIKYIPDVAAPVVDSGEPESLEDDLEALVVEVDKNKREREADLIRVRREKDSAVQQINDKIEGIKKRLDGMSLQAVSKLNMKLGQYERKITADINKLSDLTKALAEEKKVLNDQQLKSGQSNVSDLFVCVKQGKAKHSEHQKQVHSMRRQPRAVEAIVVEGDEPVLSAAKAIQTIAESKNSSWDQRCYQRMCYPPNH